MISTLLSRMFYVQLNFQDPFTRLRNWLFTCKISSSNITDVIFGMCHDVPRGLVVRIWRSHRRGPGSIPGVGIVPFFWKISFYPFGGLAIQLGFVNMWTFLVNESWEHVHFVIFVDQMLAQLHELQFMEVSLCNENWKQDFKMYVQMLSLSVKFL